MEKVGQVLSKAGVSPEKGSVIEWDVLYGVLRVIWAEAWKENYNRYMDVPYIFKDRWLFNEVHKVEAAIFACVLCQVVVSAKSEKG